MRVCIRLLIYNKLRCHSLTIGYVENAIIGYGCGFLPGIRRTAVDQTPGRVRGKQEEFGCQS